MKRISILELVLLISCSAFLLRACIGLIAERSRAQGIERCTIDYDPGLGIPRMVAWSIRPEDIGKVKRDPSFKFKPDKSQPRPWVRSSHYNRSGYQRGHMCPAADRSADRSSMKSTFVMSNVCPMGARLNQQDWKILEIKAREQAKIFGTCSVLAAPIFFPADTPWIGNGRVAVPHAFFRAHVIPDHTSWRDIWILNNRK